MEGLKCYFKTRVKWGHGGVSGIRRDQHLLQLLPAGIGLAGYQQTQRANWITTEPGGKNIMHENIKQAVGIETASCESCINFGTEDDGNYPEYAVSWNVCHRFEQYHHLKSFPFKKEMKCWHPEFWASKFPGLIKQGRDEEVTEAIDKFNKAIEKAAD